MSEAYEKALARANIAGINEKLGELLSADKEALIQEIEKFIHESELAAMYWSDAQSGFQSEELMAFRESIEKFANIIRGVK